MNCSVERKEGTTTIATTTRPLLQMLEDILFATFTSFH